MGSETAEDMSNISSWSSALPEELHNLNLEDIHDYLSSKIVNLNKELVKLNEIENNNPTEEPIPEGSQIGDFLAKLRLKRINSLAETLKDFKLIDYTPFPLHLTLDIITELKKEVNELENLVIKSKKELVDSKEELVSIENQIKLLDDIMEKRKTEGEMVEEESFEAISRAVNQEFTKHKKEMEELLIELYPNDKQEIRDVLRNATEKYFEDGDDYIELDADFDYNCIEFLFEADILERHPYDLNKIKLARLYD